MTTFRIALALAALLACTAAYASPVPTIAVPSSAVLSGIPAAAGTGLAAAYYDLSTYTATVELAAKMAASESGPAATFIAKTICFPTCGATMKDGSSVSGFARVNGTELAGDTIMARSYSTFTGALLIPTAGIYNFNLFSDDGASLMIGNTLITEMSGPQSWSGTSTSVTFTAAGLYAIAVDQFDIGGYDGVTLLENGSAIATAALYATTNSGPTSSGIVVSGSNAVPEPASLSLFGTGFIGLIAGRKRWLRRGASN